MQDVLHDCYIRGQGLDLGGLFLHHCVVYQLQQVAACEDQGLGVHRVKGQFEQDFLEHSGIKPLEVSELPGPYLEVRSRFRSLVEVLEKRGYLFQKTVSVSF